MKVLQARPGGQSDATIFAPGRLESLCVLGFAFAIGLGVTLALGKDSNWDLVNYHFYIAHALTQPAEADVFMPAGPNSYFNALGYLPFYWMVAAGWHSMAVAGVLGVFHASALLLVWWMARRFIFAGDARGPWLSAAAMALAAGSPVWLGTLGSSFLDPTLAVFVLGGVAGALRACEDGRQSVRTTWLLAAGALMGLATALKLTAVVYALALTISLLLLGWHAGGPARALRSVVPLGAGMLAAYALAHGKFAFDLYTEFGNPLFPFFNHWFQSPDFATDAFDHDRFKLRGLTEWLAYPLRMALPQSWIYTENKAPDLRPAATLLLAAGVAAQALWRRSTRPPPPRPDDQALLLPVFCLLAWLLWCATTGNGRYALPLLLLFGPLAVQFAARLRLPSRWLGAILTALVLLQIAHMANAGNPRWKPTPWATQWFMADVPQALSREAQAFVSLGPGSSYSAIVPLTHPRAQVVSLHGTYAFRPDGPGNERFRAYFERSAARLRSLFHYPIRSDTSGAAAKQEMVDRQNQLLAPWGLQVAEQGCVDLELDPYRTDATQHRASSATDGATPKHRWQSCPLRPGATEPEQVRRKRARIESALRRIEAHCPSLFRPRGQSLTRYGDLWHMSYLQSDVRVSISGQTMSLSRHDFGPFGVPLGTLEDWEAGRKPFRCEPLPRRW